jgi:hypothetical protein
MRLIPRRKILGLHLKVLLPLVEYIATKLQRLGVEIDKTSSYTYLWQF